jgi:hypothetical protein
MACGQNPVPKIATASSPTPQNGEDAVFHALKSSRYRTCGDFSTSREAFFSAPLRLSATLRE